MSGGLPNMGNTCYVNAALQAVRSVVNVVCPATDADGPLLRALRRFVDAEDEAGAEAFLGLVGSALGRDMHSPSDTSEFLRDLVSLLALENGAIERAFQSMWVPMGADIHCAVCGSETPGPEEAYAGMEVCTKEYVMHVPAVPETPRVTLAEALPLLEREYKLDLDTTQELICPVCECVKPQLLPRYYSYHLRIIDREKDSCAEEAGPAGGACPQLCKPLCDNGEPFLPPKTHGRNVRPCLCHGVQGRTLHGTGQQWACKFISLSQ